MSSWSCDQKVCASCRYWLGQRKVDFTASFFEAVDDKGPCAAPHGGFRGAEMYEGSSCWDWEAFKGRDNKY